MGEYAGERVVRHGEWGTEWLSGGPGSRTEQCQGVPGEAPRSVMCVTIWRIRSQSVARSAAKTCSGRIGAGNGGLPHISRPSKCDKLTPA